MNLARALTFIGILFLCTTSGCDAIDELTKFNMDYNTQVVIESSANIDLPFDVFSPDVETNSESEFAINDTRKDLIEQIILRELNLTITAPEEEDFSFLESVNIYISAEGLPETQIASMDEVPDNNTGSLQLVTVGTDIKEYIKMDSFSLRLNTVTDEIITSDYYIDVDAVFFVDAKILGI